MISPFHNGFWTWDEDRECLKFNSRDVPKLARGPSVTTITTMIAPVTTNMKFKEVVDTLEQVRFKRQFQRQCRPDEKDVVTIQDVKDVALFLANAEDLTPDFIDYVHIPTIDRFIRALIIYFQYYVQVWDDLMKRREEATRKLWQPVVDELENIVRDDLADLRSMVSREYCSIIVGKCDAKKFHHMNNKNNQSQSGKDRQLFERLICVAGRAAWVALERKNITLIEMELNRLLRSNKFNMVAHNIAKTKTTFFMRKGEKRILKGSADVQEKKLLTRSPTTKELVVTDHDHRMLAIGVVEIEPTDERFQYIEIAYAAPEELLLDYGVTVGILGLPRDEFEPLLTPKERTSEDINKEPRQLPPFKLPPRVQHRDETMPPEFPKKPCRFSETRQTAKSRERQKRMWQNYVDVAARRRSSDSFGPERTRLMSMAVPPEMNL